MIIVGFSAMWIYAWFFAPRGNVDRFPDRAWSDAAERVCAVTAEDVAALPAASTFADIEPKAEALRQRAEVIDEATVMLGRQVEALRATEPADDKSRKGVALWLADWDGYLQSRRDQADRLRQGEDRPVRGPGAGRCAGHAADGCLRQDQRHAQLHRPRRHRLSRDACARPGAQALTHPSPST